MKFFLFTDHIPEAAPRKSNLLQPMGKPLQLLFGILLALFLTFIVTCAKSEGPAEALYSVGQLEEKQYNPEHATEIYQKIIEKYPDTPWAEKARKRIKDIENKN